MQMERDRGTDGKKEEGEKKKRELIRCTVGVADSVSFI